MSEPQGEFATQEWVGQLAQILDKNFQTTLKLLEDRIDILERQYAELMIGYGDMAAVLQTVMLSVVSKLSKEEQIAFDKAYNDQKKEMLKAVQDGVRQANSSQPGFHPYGEPDPDQSDTKD